MTTRLQGTLAHASVELRLRLRSAATPLALLLVAAASFLWMPRPGGRLTSLSWKDAHGTLVAPVFDSTYLGVVTAILGATFVLLVAFYLVVGVVARDGQAGVGVLIAASPTRSAEYLLGKLLGHVTYLGIVCALIVTVGLLRFLAHGVGPLDAAAVLLPSALTLGPAVVFVAVAALVFDVSRGLRGRGGLVAWFFVSMFGLLLVPGLLSGALGASLGVARLPIFDPGGLISLQVEIARSFGSASPDDLSMGLIVHDQPPRLVAWHGPALGIGFAIARLGAFAWAVPPFVLAVALFDRFDPARRLRSGRAAAATGAPEPCWSAPAVVGRTSVVPRPAVLGAVLAEAHLIWDTASWLRWPLVLAALAAAVPAATVSRPAAAVFLLLIAPLVSEVSAREALWGTRALVLAQPSVPRHAVLWKLGAVATFLGAVGAPLGLRALASSPSQGLAVLAGLGFVASLAVGAGLLTRGGKLFTCLYLVIWYAALNGIPAFDYAGVLSDRPRLAVSLAYLAGGLLFAAVASAVGPRLER